MTDFPIKYRLIKKEKHTGARLGEIITPHGTFPTLSFIAKIITTRLTGGLIKGYKPILPASA